MTPYATLDDWIAAEAISFSLDSAAICDSAVDRLFAALDGPVQVLGFGEALHGGEELLILRNRLFERLVAAYGFRAIAVESSFPRGRLVDDYVAGRGSATYDAVIESGFSHGFGKLEANRDLVEWMRQYNTGRAERERLRFYGFDSPTEMMFADSPRQLLRFVLDYLSSIDGAAAGQERRARIDSLLGDDSAWENPEAAFDPAKSIGLSPAAVALRIETEELVSELRVRRPELMDGSNADRFWVAESYAALARQLLTYHAAVARPSPNRIAELLGQRDAMMADNLASIAEREHKRGRVLAFAHNQHLKFGPARWQLGPQSLEWWPAGAHLRELLGPRYAVIGSALGSSDANGIGVPEQGTLEARLVATAGTAQFIPCCSSLAASNIADLPTRTGSTKNHSYFPLTPECFAEFDWLAVVNWATYTRGGPELPG